MPVLAHRLPFVLLVFAACSSSAAQEAPEPAPLTAEHAVLQRFAGDWKLTNECAMGPGGEPVTGSGVIHSRLLGERWVHNRFEMEGVDGVQTIGYDPAKEKYVGTWVDTMTDHLWVYSGSFDGETQTLTLEAEGPSMTEPGKTALFRDVYRFDGADRIEMTSLAQGEDGAWAPFMTGVLQRVGKPSRG